MAPIPATRRRLLGDVSRPQPGMTALLAVVAGSLAGAAILVAATSLLVGCAPSRRDPAADRAPVVRVALFNIRELSTAKLTAVDESGVGSDPQARAAAAIIQRVGPDILVLQEIDHDYDAPDRGLELNARRFADAYLAQGAAPIDYPHAWAGPSNTGILSGEDLDGDGHVATDEDRGTRTYGNDALGYGEYPGQYSMAVLSRHPVDAGSVRSFRELPWARMPGNHIPPAFYDESDLAVLPLSSKSHQDVPVRVGGRRLHLLISHPTPPVFDGEEDRNGRRNFDEIRLWAEYLDNAPWLVDDQGRAGGYESDEPFVIVGDMNARPGAAESAYDGVPAIEQLLRHERVQDPAEVVVSTGAPADHRTATTAFRGVGARIDYLLPSVGLEVVGGGVFWPSKDEDPQGHALALEASDHRMVWLDLRLSR